MTGTMTLTREELDALILGLPWQRTGKASASRERELAGRGNSPSPIGGPKGSQGTPRMSPSRP
jgi:hypothetical protein